jgi:hypothetical protein
MEDKYKVVQGGKTLHRGTQEDCDHWAIFNAQHGDVVPDNDDE